MNDNKLLYHHILESMNNGVIALNYEGKIITFNKAASLLLDLDIKDVLNKYYSEVFFQIEGNEEFNDVLINLLTEHKINVYKEVNFRKKNNDLIPLGMTSSLLIDEHGNDYGIVSVFYDLSELRKTKFLEDTLTRYVTKQVVDLIMEHPDDIILDGEEREATILFTDIRDFTTIAETMNPKKLIKMLREYFTLMVNVTFKYQGTVDKFIGDSLMVIFGAPTPQPDHSLLAIDTALEMQTALINFNKNKSNKNYKNINMGIGINTGKIIVGNIGSEERLEYTAIGDSVNLASRLEGTNKLYGTNIVISENTYNKIKDKFVCRNLDRIQVKGKNNAIEIFEVLSRNENTTKRITNLKNKFESGLQFYREQNWEEAIKVFSELNKTHPADKASKLYISRSIYYQKNKPAQNWNGTYIMHHK